MWSRLHLQGWSRQMFSSLMLTVIVAVAIGLIYPAVVWGIGQVAFKSQADGSLVYRHGQVVGSTLIAQGFSDKNGNPLPQYFQPRPSYAIVDWSLGQEKNGTYYIENTGPNNYGCNPLYSSASNLGPTNPAQIQFVKQRQAQISKFDNVPISKIPPDAVTASGSGLDPDISPANAAIQVDRVAAARHITPAQVEALVKQYTTGRTIGFLGEPVVNVLLLNIALDEKYPV